MAFAPAGYHAIRDTVVGAVDDVFSEPVRLSFMANGVADPGRAQKTIQAVIRTGASKNTVLSGGQVSQTWRSRIAGGKAELHIDRARYPDVKIRKGDSIRAMSRPGQPVFEVLSVDDRNHVRLIAELGEA